MVSYNASPLLNVAIRAVHAGGRVLRDNFNLKHCIKDKGWQDIVTDVDLESQRAITDVLQETSTNIIGEESDDPLVLIGKGGQQWLIDPLDGTNNYVRHICMFCISIALLDGDEPTIGVVYDPMRGETFCAERGKGAFHLCEGCEPRNLSVNSEIAWDRSIIGTDWPRKVEDRMPAAMPYGKIMHECMAVRTMGSSALGITYVAQGSLDGYYHFSIKPWDAVAGSVIASESGAKITSIDGGHWNVRERSIIVANQNISRILSTIVKGNGSGIR